MGGNWKRLSVAGALAFRWDGRRARFFFHTRPGSYTDRALIAFLRRPQRPLTAADLAQISCQVLVVLGDQDPAGPGDGLAAALPAARLVTLRGVDHFGTPADVRCMQAVLGFLGC